MRRIKKIGWIVLSVVIIATVLIKIFTQDKSVRSVTAEKVQLRTIVESVSASGKIQPETEVKIQSEVSGQIIDLAVREGDVVAKGQLLLHINPDLYHAALNRAEAALNSAKSSLSGAKARLVQAEAQFKLQEQIFNRTKKLFQEKAISQADMDNTASAFETAQAEVTAAQENIHSATFSIASAEAGRNEANDNLRRTTIVAPMGGTVTALTKEIGETVLGNNMMSGDVIMKISALDLMEVNVEVNESDIVRVEVGDTADVAVDAFRDITFRGVVSEIGNTALNALSANLSMDQVTNFSVKVQILRASYQHLCEGHSANYSPFRPGMSATVDIKTKTEKNILSIPIKAVTTRTDTTSVISSSQSGKKNQKTDSSDESPQDSFTVVFVMDEQTGIAAIRRVETGIQDDRFIHVIKGLQEGETVITGPYEEVSKKLNSGEKVKPM